MNMRMKLVLIATTVAACGDVRQAPPVQGTACREPDGAWQIEN
jgi:surface antigen